MKSHVKVLCRFFFQHKVIRGSVNSVVFKYLNSVGPLSDVLEDACSSGLVHILHRDDLLKMKNSARPAGCIEWVGARNDRRSDFFHRAHGNLLDSFTSPDERRRTIDKSSSASLTGLQRCSLKGPSCRSL